MFVVPVLEMTEAIAIVPEDYLPYYMFSTVVLRRVVRVVQDWMKEREGAQ
jgi:hypothetical protein